MQKRILALLFFFPFALLAQKANLVIPTGHDFEADLAKTDPTGRFLVSSDSKSLLLWDKKNQRQLRNFNLGGYKTSDFCFSPDGKQLVAGSQSHLICYDMADDRELWNIPDLAMYSAVYFDNGQKIFAIGMGSGYILEAKTGAILKKIPGFYEVAYGFKMETSKVFVLAGNVGLLVAGNVVSTVNLNNPGVPTVTEFKETIWKFAVDTKRGLVFFRETHLGIITVFDALAGKTIKTLPLAQSGDWRFTVSAEQDALFVEYNEGDAPFLRGMVRFPLPGLDAPQVVKLPAMPDRSYLLSASSKGDFFHFSTGEMVRPSSGTVVAKFGGAVCEIVTPGGPPPTYWATEQTFGFMTDLKNRHFRLLDLRTGQTRTMLDLTRADGTGETDLFDFSADGRQFIVQNQEETALLLYDVKSKKLRKTYPRTEGDDTSIRFLKFSADGKSVFSHSEAAGGIVSLNLATGATRNICKTWGECFYAISPNAKFVGACWYIDEVASVGVWELETGKQLMVAKTDETGMMHSFDVSADGKYLFMTGEAGSKMYEVATKRRVPNPNVNSFSFSQARFSPTNHYYAVGESDGELTAGKMPGGDRFEKRRHGNGINAVLFSADEKVVFTASYDHSIALTAMSDGTFLGSLYGFDDPKDWLIVTPDGRYDGSEAAFKKLYYVKGFDVLPLDALFEKFYTPGLYAMLLSGEKLPPVDGDINNLKAAPKVKITFDSKQRNLSVEDDAPTYLVETEQITLKMEATCPEDGVTEIRLFQNGKLVQSTRNLTVEDDVPTGEKTLLKSFTVLLSEGENRFKAVAYNTQRTESQPDEIVVSFKNAKPAPSIGGIQCWLVVVAVNQYKNPKYNLNYATADAKAFKESIEAHGKTLFSKINTELVQDAAATKTGIMAALNRAKAAAGPKDLLIFYYAGHGVMAGDDGKQTFYLVPQDVTQLYGNDEALAQKGVSVTELRAFSQETKAQKQLFILDACQSAGAIEGLAMRGAAEEKAIAQLARSTGTHWLTASGSEQFASEFDELGHGAFTYVLLEALSGKADLGGDGKVTVKELDAYLQDNVPILTKKHKGTPQWPASYGFGNDFPIGVVK